MIKSISSLKYSSVPASNVFNPSFGFSIKSRPSKCQLKDSNNQSHNVVIHYEPSELYMMEKDVVHGILIYSYCEAPVKGDNYPDYYKGKKYLFINHINSNKKLKGVGTELIKAAVRESQKRGCEGRICLNSSTIDTRIGSPVPFYYKMGFESSDKDIQAKIDYSIKNGLLLPKKCEATTMFLPQEKINEILSE